MNKKKKKKKERGGGGVQGTVAENNSVGKREYSFLGGEN